MRLAFSYLDLHTLYICGRDLPPLAGPEREEDSSLQLADLFEDLLQNSHLLIGDGRQRTAGGAYRNAGDQLNSGPLVVISADTAISMMAVNDKQELVGGVILPGPQLSLNALVKNTAQLPQIDLAAKAPESILGKSTSACLQNGFVLGTASQLDGLAARFCAELGPQTAFYATGNLPLAIRDACRTPIRYRETLITDGLYRIWLKNKKG